MRGRFHHASPRDDAGFTLVELLVSMVVVTLILSSISMALYLALHNIDATADTLTTSRYAQSLGVWLPSDVETADVNGIDIDTATVTGCSGPSPGTNLVHLTSSDGATDVSYRIVPAGSVWQLVRYNCAIGGAPLAHVVVDGMPSASSASVVAARGNPLVTVTASSQSGRSAPYTFSITGSTRAPLLGPCTVMTFPETIIVVDATRHLPEATELAVLTTGACSGLALRLTPASSVVTVPLVGGPTAWTATLTTGLTWSTGVKTVAFTGAVAPSFDLGVKQVSSTSLTSSASSSPFGDPLALTARVTGVSGTATGTVIFYDGDTILGQQTLKPDGTTSLTTSALTVASHPIFAVYSGDAVYQTSASTVLDEVVKQRPRIVLTSSINPTSFTQSVRFDVTVAGDFGVPTGTVTFSDGATLLAMSALDGAGSASFSTTALSIGSHTITASYGGDGAYLAGQSSSVVQVVTRRPSAATVTVDRNPSVVGQQVFYTVRVTGGGPAPTGRVEMWDGSVAVAAGTLDVVTGQVRIPATFAAVGTHPMIAKYVGDGNYLPSQSAPLDQVVKLVSSFSIASSVNPSLLGQSVQFTATVTPSAPVPSGSVSFFDGVNLVGTATVDGTGSATLALDPLAIGNHAITATYTGDATYASSTSPVLNQTVNAPPCTVVTHGSTSPDPILRSGGRTAADVTFSIQTTSGCGTMTLTLSDPEPIPTIQSAGPTTWTWLVPSGSDIGGGTLTIQVLDDGVVIDTWTTRLS